MNWVTDDCDENRDENWYEEWDENWYDEWDDEWYDEWGEEWDDYNPITPLVASKYVD